MGKGEREGKKGRKVWREREGEGGEKRREGRKGEKGGRERDFLIETVTFSFLFSMLS